MTGIENLKIANAQEAVDKFFSLGCNTVIITFGAQGAVHASHDKRKIVHTPTEPVKAVDTTVSKMLNINILKNLVFYILQVIFAD